MKVQSSITFACLVGLASAQDQSFIQKILTPFLTTFVPVAFNLVAGTATGIFNNLIGDALASFDPYDIDKDYEKEVAEKDLDNCPSNPTKVYALFNANEATGLSEFEVSRLEMTTFELNEDGSLSGFELELKGGEAVAIDMDGTMGPKTTDCATYDPIEFTGVALLSNAVFKFGLEGDVQLTDFQVKSGNVTNFEFSWDEISITFSDLGDLDDVVDEITTQLTETAEEIAQSFIDKEFLQDAIDSVLPFPSK